MLRTLVLEDAAFAEAGGLTPLAMDVLADTELHVAFARFDGEGSGSISLVHFEEVLGSLRTDTGTGITDLLGSHSNVRRFARHFDKDGDGRIDYGEFVKASIRCSCCNTASC